MLRYRTGKHVGPVAYCVPSSGALHDVREVHPLHDGVEVLVGHPGGAELCERLRVDDLLAQAAEREVRALRNVENLCAEIECT